MPNQTIAEQFDRIEEFTALIGAADLNTRGEWDEQFIADLRATFKRYGAHTFLSDAQREQLERIANQ